MRQWTWSSLPQVIACHLIQTKPLPETMLAFLSIEKNDSEQINFPRQHNTTAKHCLTKSYLIVVCTRSATHHPVFCHIGIKIWDFPIFFILFLLSLLPSRSHLPRQDSNRMNIHAGPRLKIKTILPGIGIPIIKVRRSFDRLIFIMGIPLLRRWRLLYQDTPLTFNNLLLQHSILPFKSHTNIKWKYSEHRLTNSDSITKYTAPKSFASENTCGALIPHINTIFSMSSFVTDTDNIWHL